MHKVLCVGRLRVRAPVSNTYCVPTLSSRRKLLEIGAPTHSAPVDDEVMLNVLRCQLTYLGQVVTNAEAWFNNSLRPRKPEGSLGRTAQDVHLDSHTAPELCVVPGRVSAFHLLTGSPMTSSLNCNFQCTLVLMRVLKTSRSSQL